MSRKTKILWCVLLVWAIFVGALLFWDITTANSAEFTTDITINQVACTDDDEIETNIKLSHGEQLMFKGVFADSQHLLHFFVNKITGTWSIIGVGLKGEHCLIFYGDGLVPYTTIRGNKRGL